MRRLLEPNQRDLARLSVAKMHEDRRRLFGEVRDPGLVHGRLIAADGPRGSLRRLIDGTGNTLDLFGADIVIVAPNDALRIDGNLKDVVRGRRVPLDKSEDAQRQPL